MTRRRLNPVLARELRERMRRKRAVLVLTSYLVVLALIMWATYKGVAASGARVTCTGDRCVTQANPLAAAAAGRPMFHWLLFFVLMLVCFIVPGVTSGAVAGERERQTLVPLQVTLLSPLAILVGKLLSSLAFTVLLLVATLPLMSVAYAIGGISFGEVVRGLAMVVVVAAALGCISIACSAVFRRVQGATVASYSLVLLLVVGTLVLFGINAVVRSRDAGTARLNLALLVGNPFIATADVIGRNPQAGFALESPFTLAQDLLERVTRGDPSEASPADPVPAEGPQGGSRFWRSVPFWLVTLGFYLLLSAASLRLAAGRIRAPAPGVAA